MAIDKKSVLLYCDIIHTIEQLDDVDAGLLFKHYLRYINDLNPEPPSKLIQIVFEPIKQNLKRDLKKWEGKINNFSEAGKTSAKVKRLINEPQLYIIKLYNENEEFIKVGITDYSISRRFRSSGDGMSKLGYKFDVLYQYFKSDVNTSLVDVEMMISEGFKEYRYLPNNKFGGYLECYNIEALDYIKSFCDKMFNNVKQRSTFSTVTDKVIVKDNVKVKDKDNNKFNAIAFMCELGFNESLVKEWFEVRKLKKLKNTETALTGFHSEVLKTNKPINEILKTCVEKSWGGFKSDWIKDKSDISNQPLMQLINNINK